MMILKSWSESLSLLKPSSFKLFFLVTLKSIISVYKALAFRFWPVVLFGALCAVYAPFYSIVFMQPILALLIVLLARPSVLPKNYLYIIQHLPHIMWLAPMAILFGVLLCTSYVAALIPLAIFYAVSVLDSYAQPKDIIESGMRATKMLVLNMPFCAVLMAFFYGMGAWCLVPVFKMAAACSVGYQPALIYYMLTLCAPVMICFFVNMYTKKIYEQFGIYY